jgi:hypothetical protein
VVSESIAFHDTQEEKIQAQQKGWGQQGLSRACQSLVTYSTSFSRPRNARVRNDSAVLERARTTQYNVPRNARVRNDWYTVKQTKETRNETEYTPQPCSRGQERLRCVTRGRAAIQAGHIATTTMARPPHILTVMTAHGPKRSPYPRVMRDFCAHRAERFEKRLWGACLR